MEKVTERSSNYQDLDKMSVQEILTGINQEDHTVPAAVARAIPQIEALVTALVPRMRAGGRLFYIGAGTSGRLGVVDASEIPPTYGAPPSWVLGIIAGGDTAIRKSVENAEDSTTQAWEDLRAHDIGELDTVIGIAASGTTPYVIHGLRTCRTNGIVTACITCNPGAPLLEEADFPIVAVVGPEFVTGSTRMKSGTAQKLILNMISTATMIQLGRVRGNRMVDMQLSNVKLIDRGVKMVMEGAGIADYDTAKQYLEQFGSVRAAIDAYLL
jgi:N-acetylmuramic acid 6-phosphate etherase